jgi:hypothetical protein
MKKIFFLLACCLPVQILSAQVNYSDAKKYIAEQAKINTPFYTNDNNTSSTPGSFLFNEVMPASYDLLAANLAFSEKNQVQKISFAPLRLKPIYIPALSGSKINLTNNGGAITAGFSIGDDYSIFESKRVTRIFNSVYSFDTSTMPKARARGLYDSTETLKQYLEWYKTSGVKAFQDSVLKEFDRRRLLHVFKWNAGMNMQFFPVLKSKSQEGIFDSLNYHGNKGQNFFIGGSYSFANGSINVNAAYNYYNKRKSADSTQEKRKYNGFSFGTSLRLFRLIKKSDLEKKDFYKASLFVPSVYAGFSFEKQTYKGAEAKFAEDKLKWVSVTSFFVDVAVSPASQFRLSFPIKKSQEFNIVGKSTGLVTVLQYNFKLINLN